MGRTLLSDAFDEVDDLSLPVLVADTERQVQRPLQPPHPFNIHRVEPDPWTRTLKAGCTSNWVKLSVLPTIFNARFGDAEKEVRANR